MKSAPSFAAALLLASAQANPLFRRFDNTTQINNGTIDNGTIDNGTAPTANNGTAPTASTAPTAPTAPTATTAPTKPTYPPLTGPCTPGSFGCNSNTTFSQCVPTSGSTTAYIYMGAVPGGMICQNGQIVRDTLGPCSPPGTLECLNNGSTFGLCAPDGLIYMGIVAAGTICQNGTIVAAPGY